MKSINNQLEKLNKIIPSKQISYNIENKKCKNKYFFFCFIIYKNYKDKIEIFFENKKNIIKPDSLNIKSYDFLEKRFIFKSNLKRFLYFYEIEIPYEFNELKIILKYNENNNNYQCKCIERNTNLLINIDISPIYLELDKTNITYKLSNFEEYKKILEYFIEFFSCKEINVKKEFLCKLFNNKKKLYIENLFLLSKLFDNNNNSLYEKINAILYFINNKEIESIENYKIENIKEEIIYLYKNIEDSKSEKLWYFIIINLLKMNEYEKALKIILRIKDDKIRIEIIKKISLIIIGNIVQIYNSIVFNPIASKMLSHKRIPKDSKPFLDIIFLKRLIKTLDYIHIKEEKIKFLESEIGEKISFMSKDNHFNYTIEIQLKEKFISKKENKRIKELEKLNIELKQKINKLNEETKNCFEKPKKELKDKLEVKEKSQHQFNNNNLICVTFFSLDESIIYSMICQNRDKFEILENKFYDKYPEYAKAKISFLLDGNEINRFKSLEENKIGDNNIIVFNSSLL